MFCSPAGRSGLSGCHTFCKCTIPLLHRCSFLVMSLCRIYSAQYVAVSLILRFDSLLLSLHSYRIALSVLHIRVTAVLAPALFLSAADPHASGQAASAVRSARSATLLAITTAAIAVCVSFSPSITDPHTSGRIIACAHCTHTATLC